MNSVNQLKFALNDAQMAHHDYEQGLGRRDANWTDWYADYMVKHGIMIDGDELAALIREADAAYQNSNEQEVWQLFTANYIFDKLP